MHAARPVPADRASCWPWPAGSPPQQRLPAGAGTLPTHRPLFVVLLTGVALVVVGLTYVPVLSLGPIVESLREPSSTPSTRSPGRPLAARSWPRLPDALRKLDPRELRHHPVMLVVEIGAVVTTVLAIVDPSVVRLAASPSGCG